MINAYIQSLSGQIVTKFGVMNKNATNRLLYWWNQASQVYNRVKPDVTKLAQMTSKNSLVPFLELCQDSEIITKINATVHKRPKSTGQAEPDQLTFFDINNQSSEDKYDFQEKVLATSSGPGHLPLIIVDNYKKPRYFSRGYKEGNNYVALYVKDVTIDVKQWFKDEARQDILNVLGSPSRNIIQDILDVTGVNFNCTLTPQQLNLQNIDAKYLELRQYFKKNNPCDAPALRIFKDTPTDNDKPSTHESQQKHLVVFGHTHTPRASPKDTTTPNEQYDNLLKKFGPQPQVRETTHTQREEETNPTTPKDPLVKTACLTAPSKTQRRTSQGASRETKVSDKRERPQGKWKNGNRNKNRRTLTSATKRRLPNGVTVSNKSKLARQQQDQLPGKPRTNSFSDVAGKPLTIFQQQDQLPGKPRTNSFSDVAGKPLTIFQQLPGKPRTNSFSDV